MPTPPDPGYFDKVNYVIDAWAMPCEAPWYIYVSTLKPAALAAFITLLTFGWDDVLRGFARPKGLGRGRRTMKKRGKGKIGLRGFPEIGELLGRQLPGSEQVKGIKWSDGLKTLWRIDTVVQGFLFAWLVADVTNDFAFEWTSLSPGIWNEIAYTSKDYEFPFPNWVVTFGNTGVLGATISFSIDWQPWNPAAPPSSYSSRLIDKTTGDVLAETGPTLADGNGAATHIISADVPRSHQFGVQGWAEGNWAYAQDGAIIGMAPLL